MLHKQSFGEIAYRVGFGFSFSSNKGKFSGLVVNELESSCSVIKKSYS